MHANYVLLLLCILMRTELRIQLLYLQLLHLEYAHMLLCRPCHRLHFHLPLRWRVHELVHLWHPHPHGGRTK